MGSSTEKMWQILFWAVTALFVAGASFIGNNVISNDRIRTQEDQRIEQKFDNKCSELNNVINKQYQEIIQRLARIEAKVGN